MGFIFRPHVGQREVWLSPARFRHVCCGRRFGKTRLLAAEAARALVRSYPHSDPPRAWLVAPSYKLAAEAWDQPGGILEATAPLSPTVNRTERSVRLPSGAQLEVRTADNPDNLRGGGLDFLGVDEAAFLKEAAWMALRPTVSDRLGRVLMTSTPKGRNWWYREWKQGQGESASVQSWQMPSLTNPSFPKEEWDAAREALPAEWFSQEYEADFLAARPAVFRGLDGVLFEPGPSPRVHAGPFIHGIDVGSAHDFTALVTIDASSGEVCNLFRIRHHPYRVIADVVAQVIYSEFRGTAYADATGVGPALIEPLREMGVQVAGCVLTNPFKARLISGLLVAIGSGRIRIPSSEPFAPLVTELREFEMGYTSSGQVTFGGRGEHDDCVIALALAWYGASQGAIPREVGYGMA